MMSQLNKVLLVILSFLFFSGMAHAITISFDPVPSSLTVGDSFDVAVVVSELGDGSAPSISTFDLDIEFIDSQLAFTFAVFGDPVLGNQLDIFELGFNPTFAGETNPSVINIFELSLDPASDLNDFQADSFTLATLTFDVLGVGIESLDIFINALGDADGNLLLADTESADIITTIPLPATAWLFLTGLSALGFSMRRKPTL